MKKKSEQKEKNEVVIRFEYNSSKIFPSLATLGDLKAEISKNLLMREDEYELFIGELSLSKISGKTSLQQLINDNKTSNFVLKSDNNIFDLRKKLVDYNEFLDKKIEQQENDITDFKSNLISLENELSQIETDD